MEIDCPNKDCINGYVNHKSSPTSCTVKVRCSICNGKGSIIDKPIYTEAEMKKAVDDEREGCALECDNVANEIDFGEGFAVAIRCEKAIRARGE